MEKIKLRPCDCPDWDTAQKLNEQGIGSFRNSIYIEPNVVIMEIDKTTTIKIPMKDFKIFAEWYLESQEIEDDTIYHECIYSKAMNQKFPRKCIKCGKPEGSTSICEKS